VRVGKKCRHCGAYRVWRQSDLDGALVADNDYACAVSPTRMCEVLVETVAARATRELAAGAGKRALGRGIRKHR
jgi:hypothetical protein